MLNTLFRAAVAEVGAGRGQDGLLRGYLVETDRAGDELGKVE